MIKKLVPKKKDDAETTVTADEPVDGLRVDKKTFFTLILSAKLIGHILHLQAVEFAVHIALDEFYKGTQKNADKIIEVWQGAAKEIMDYDKETMVWGMDLEPLEYLSHLREVIQHNRYNHVPKTTMSNVQNEIDNFISTLDTAVYKITYLK
jgi:acyl-CoA hydrolase